jgi:hypothetical protein
MMPPSEVESLQKNQESLESASVTFKMALSLSHAAQKPGETRSEPASLSGRPVSHPRHQAQAFRPASRNIDHRQSLDERQAEEFKMGYIFSAFAESGPKAICPLTSHRSH